MNTTKQHDYTLQYSLIPFFYWAAFCSITSYASFYLLSIGYKNSTIGIIIAIAGTISAILQPIVAGYADRPDSVSLKKIIQIVGGIQLIGYIFLFSIHQKAFLVTGILYGMEIGLHQIVTPLVNSLGTETLNQGKKLNYGIARAMGSVSYALIAFLLGIITTRTESSSVLATSIILIFLMELCLILFPFQKQPKSNEASQKVGVNGFAFFRRYKKYTILLVGCILIFISHVLINNFTLQIVQSKGGGTAEMGTGQAIASIIELPTMFLFGWMMKKAAVKSWFRITGIFFFLKCFATLLAPTIPIFYGVQFLQLFAWALITVSSVYYVNSIMEECDKIKGQAYYTMTYTVGSVFGSLLGGAMLENFSANAMLLSGSVCSLIGAIIIFFAA